MVPLATIFKTKFENMIFFVKVDVVFKFNVLELVVNRLIVIRTGLSLSCISQDPMSNV